MSNVIYLNIQKAQAEKVEKKMIRQLAQQVHLLINPSSELNYASVLGQTLQPNDEFLHGFVREYLTDFIGERPTAEMIAKSLYARLEYAQMNRLYEGF